MSGQLWKLVGLGLTLAAVTTATPAWAASTERVNVGPSGVQADGFSSVPAISADGRFVVFGSTAPNLVPNDTNGEQDIFVHDRRTDRTRRVSLGAGGVQGNDFSQSAAAISADGRLVAFYSAASNLVPNDSNGRLDVFVRDLAAGTTRRASVATGGAQANGDSIQLAMSASGRTVAFESTATNLVPDDSNGTFDIFTRDLETGVTTRVSVSSSGVQASSFSRDPAISGSGRFVGFVSPASNLVPDDTNGESDVFVHNRRTGETRRVSVATGKVQANGPSFGRVAISADGRYVAFGSAATNLVANDTNGVDDVFVHDMQTGVTRRVSVAPGGAQGNGFSSGAAISADGRFVAFESEASNLVPNDTNRQVDVLVRDLETGSIRRASLRRNGGQGNDLSSSPALSADGRIVAFHSHASNLVPNDTNGELDIFVRTP